ncbi:MAG: hypothetical protein MUF77_00380 [Leptospira sp.]|nr:hypothetical protein [Leptospira sp.]
MHESRPKLGIYVRYIKESLPGYMYFGIAGAFIYSLFLIYDFWSGEYKENLTYVFRIIIIALCLTAVQIIKRTKLTNYYLMNYIMSAIFFFEIEIQATGVVPYWEFESWFSNLIFLLFLSFFFRGKPKSYFVFLIILLSYYFARTISSYEGELTEAHQFSIIMTYFYMVTCSAMSLLLNLYWFNIRYQFLFDIHKAAIDRAKISEQKVEIATLKEREKIFMDIHDHLGGKILEVYLSLDTLKGNLTSDSQHKQINDSQLALREIREIIRDRMRSIDEISLFKENTEKGIQYIINSRYTKVNKEVNVSISAEVKLSSILERIKKESKDILYFILSEMINNDIQYGKEKAIWRIEATNDYLFFKLKNVIDVMQSKGVGTSIILSRCKQINASFEAKISTKSEFEGKLILPLSSMILEICCRWCRIAPWLTVNVWSKRRHSLTASNATTPSTCRWEALLECDACTWSVMCVSGV